MAEASHFPERTLESLVAEIAEEVGKLKSAKPDDPAPADDLTGFLDQESFARIERLLREALSRATPELPAKKRMESNAVRQSECNHLMLEMITHFFEAYRALTYRFSDLSRLSAAMSGQCANLRAALAQMDRRLEDLENREG